MIVVIDYGAGNLRSVGNALDAIGAEYEVIDQNPLSNSDWEGGRGWGRLQAQSGNALGAQPSSPSSSGAGEGVLKILLPGVGHFGQMMRALKERGLIEPLIQAINQGVPILGICLGMQALYEASEEAPGVLGLGLLQGTVKRLPDAVRVPQIGWNEVAFQGRHEWFYFANSFYAPVGEETIGVTEYGVSLSAAVQNENITGFQFHPEKSGASGLALLKRWVEDGR